MLNQAAFVGYVVRRVAIHVPDGESYLRVGLANTTVWHDRQGERHERSTSIFVILPDALAETVPALHRGSKLAVAGRLQNHTYRAESGQEVMTVELVAEVVDCLQVKTRLPATA